ncbi:Tn3 family transposase [Streptomyces prunicolor]|uniref:Tn3 family transposase n=1 Tax=Streptomyces prunicolor TaxID=67348 RepID=UPI00371AF7B1
MARTPLDLDELVEHWTLLRDEQALVSGKPGATRLGFTVPLKFCTQYGRFPRSRAELPREAVEFVARQVPALDMGFHDWTGRTVEYHRAQIREHFGFRQCSVANAEKLTTYLAEHVADKEHRPEQVRVELIAQQYDQMIKYATALRTRTASTDAILRRFTRKASHPTYAAMLEVGRAQKTIFVARYLRLRDLQREIEEGLNVLESSNDANSVIAYGKSGEIASNRRDEQEMFVLCLRILQSALVYVNTLMPQDILGEPEWAELLAPADRRGRTPLSWSHVRPYGEVNLDMDARLNLAVVAVSGPRIPAGFSERTPGESRTAAGQG